MINLKKGEGINLKKNFGHVTKFKIELDWDVNTQATKRSQQFELNVGAFLLTHVNGKPTCREDADFVFYNNKSDPTGAVTHNPDNWKGGSDIMYFDQDLLSERDSVDDELSVIAEVYEGGDRGQDFGHVNHATLTISDAATGEAIADFKLTENYGSATAVQMGSFIRKGNDWHFETVGKGYAKGWEAFVNIYGLAVAPDGGE